MQIQDWNDDLKLAVERRCAGLSDAAGPIVLDAARAGQGLPVHCDLGACLVIQNTGRVVTFDLDSGTVRALEDERWFAVARLAAAECYPEFAIIKPVRPETALDCSACDGTGRDPEFGLRCGMCLSLGWK